MFGCTFINNLTIAFSTCRTTVSFDLEVDGDAIDGSPIQAKLLVTVLDGHYLLFVGRIGGGVFARFDITNGIPLDIDLKNLTCVIKSPMPSFLPNELLIEGLKIRIVFPDQALLYLFTFHASGPQHNRPEGPSSPLKFEDLSQVITQLLDDENLQEYPLVDFVAAGGHVVPSVD